MSTGPAADKAAQWRATISSTYYPQDVTIDETAAFDGQISVWSLGAITVSRIKSTALTYRRRPEQIVAQLDSHHLVTVPLQSDLHFRHRGGTLRCRPGGFLTERGDQPYELHQPAANELLVVKLPDTALQTALPRGKVFANRSIGAETGVAGLFVDLVRALPARIETIEQSSRATVSRHLLELLALALGDGEQALESGETSVRRAHLHRIKRVIREHLFDPDLSPPLIARQCGISLRYLHKLFSDPGSSVGQWVRDQRLMAADEALRDPHCRDTIATIAYRCGFSDQAQFSRHYRRRFGCTPRDARSLARARGH